MPNLHRVYLRNYSDIEVEIYIQLNSLFPFFYLANLEPNTSKKKIGVTMPKWLVWKSQTLGKDPLAFIKYILKIIVPQKLKFGYTLPTYVSIVPWEF